MKTNINIKKEQIMKKLRESKKKYKFLVKDKKNRMDLNRIMLVLTVIKIRQCTM